MYEKERGSGEPDRDRKGKNTRPCVFFEAAERRIDRGPRFSPRIRIARHRASIAIPFTRRCSRRYDCCCIFFFLFRLFSLPFRPFRYFFHPISPRAPRVYEFNTRQNKSDTRYDRGKPQESGWQIYVFRY